MFYNCDHSVYSSIFVNQHAASNPCFKQYFLHDRLGETKVNYHVCVAQYIRVFHLDQVYYIRENMFYTVFLIQYQVDSS